MFDPTVTTYTAMDSYSLSVSSSPASASCRSWGSPASSIPSPAPSSLPDEDAFYTPPEELRDRDDLSLCTAAMKSVATNSQTPLIKEELRYKIQKRRRDSGKPDLDPTAHYPAKPNELTAADMERRRRRRDSNRRAAEKCRIKKKAAAVILEKDHCDLISENKMLHQKIDRLTSQYDKLKRLSDEHMAVCPIACTGQQDRLSYNNTTHKTMSDLVGGPKELKSEDNVPEPLVVLSRGDGGVQEMSGMDEIHDDLHFASQLFPVQPEEDESTLSQQTRVLMEEFGAFPDLPVLGSQELQGL